MTQANVLVDKYGKMLLANLESKRGFSHPNHEVNAYPKHLEGAN